MTSVPDCRIVVIGEPGDPHVSAVLEHMPQTGTVVVDVRSLRDTFVRWDEHGWTLRDLTGESVQVSDHASPRGWVRRYGPPEWDGGVVIGSHRAAVLTSRLTLLGALMRDVRIAWLTTSDRLAAAENKLVQHDAAHTLGILTPTTVIDAEVSKVVPAIGEPFVAKPLGVAHFQAAGQTKIVYANAVTTADLAGVDVLEAPFLTQELLVAEAHLRVVTVRDRAWVCEQPATNLPVDWRQNDEAHDAFRPALARADVADHALALAAKMGVGYSSQDWIVQGDQAFFLDLNPAGQWAFLPNEVSEAVTESIAGWLTEGNRPT